MQRVERREYLDWLARWKEKQIIKVVSGVRRCGKSTLFDIFRDYLLAQGIEPKQIIMLNFEDIAYDGLRDYRRLYEYVTERLAHGRMNYIFLDEVQHVREFERAVDSLFLKDNCDVYITGSNAYFLSGELATLLSGRYVQLRMLPLSFREFCAGTKGGSVSRMELFERYLRIGSFPYLLRAHGDSREAKEYLRDLYNTVLLKDIVARLRVADVNNLENVAKFLFHNIGSRISGTKIANTLKSANKAGNQKTVDKYLRGLTDSLLFYEATRYNIKGRQFLTTQSKYYCVDTALRSVIVQGRESDAGHVLENIVYLELLRRGYDVYVGQFDSLEVDFVAVGAEEIIYFQVALTTLDAAVLERELAPLRRIGDNHPKFLLTLDEVFGTANYDGIRKMNVVEWLLGEK